MITIINILLFIFFFILQTTIAPRLAIFGLYPNFLLILMVLYALFNKSYKVFLTAFLAGFAIDSLSAGPFGLYTLAFLLIAFLSAVLIKDAIPLFGRGFMFFLLSLIPFYVASVTYIIVSSQFYWSLLYFFVGQLILNTILFLIIFPPLRRFFLWEHKYQEKRT